MTNLQKLHFFYRDFESPASFITWPYLFMIASCLGRKVHLQSAASAIYPNIYPIIVAPPATGKSLPTNIMIKVVDSLIQPGRDGKTPEKVVNITPTCVTLEALYDFIEASTRAIKIKGTNEYYHHASVSFALGDEMGLLFKNKDSTNDLVSFLIAGYDCGEFKYKTKKSGQAEIKNMCINFMGCCTPTWMSRSMSSDIIGEGFASRCIFLWEEKKRQSTTRLNIDPDQIAAMEDLKKHFRNVAQLQGQVTETDEAYKFFDDWYQSTEKSKVRINRDKKLDYYYDRKKVNLQKVAMLCHFAERLDMTLDVTDYKNALKLLNTAELNMHKALSVATRNPLAVLADQIKKYLYTEKAPRSSNQILAAVFDGGNMDEINQAKSFLLETQQIKLTPNGFVIVEGSDLIVSEPAEIYGDSTNPALACLDPAQELSLLPESSTDNPNKP